MTDTIAPTIKTSRLLLWLPLIIGAIGALLLLEYMRETVVFRVENAAFGRETSRFMATGEGQNQCADASDSAKCIGVWHKAGDPPAVIWFGNSQLEGINRFKPGDLNAPELLHRALGARGKYVVTYSQPNANLTEEAIIWAAIQPVYRPRLLILPVCYDDIRELGVRDTVGDMLDDPKVSARLKRAPYWAQIASAVGEAMKQNAPLKAETHLSLQNRTEAAATGFLSHHWSLWSDRANMRGILGFAVHGLRNEVLGIHSTSKRPVDPSVLVNRLTLLDGMIAEARADGAQVLLYAPPYRQDIDGPYLVDDYHVFKAQLAAIAKKHGATFVDIDPIVPGPEWATVTDDVFGFQEPDFMHFTAAGHQRLAAHIDGAARRMGY